MTYPTFGLLWSKRSGPEEHGYKQLMVIMNNGDFFWSHGYMDNSISDRVHSADKLNRVLETLKKEGSYWVGPREMSGW